MELLKKDNDQEQTEIWFLEDDGKIIFFKRHLEYSKDYHSVFEIEKEILEKIFSIKSTAFDVISNIVKE